MKQSRNDNYVLFTKLKEYLLSNINSNRDPG